MVVGGGGRIFTHEPYYLRPVLMQVFNVCLPLFTIIEIGEPLNNDSNAAKYFFLYPSHQLTRQQASSEQVPWLVNWMRNSAEIDWTWKVGDVIRFKRQNGQRWFLPVTTQQAGRVGVHAGLITHPLKQGVCSGTGLVATLSQSWAPKLHILPSTCLQ